MAMELKMYWYPNCSSCKKAKKWLEDRDAKIDLIHIVESPPSKSELADYIEKSELPINKFFNTSGKKYRELNLKDKVKVATEDEKISILASDGMLMKRPIVTDGKSVTVGFKEDIFEQTWTK